MKTILKLHPVRVRRAAASGRSRAARKTRAAVRTQYLHEPPGGRLQTTYQRSRHHSS